MSEYTVSFTQSEIVNILNALSVRYQVIEGIIADGVGTSRTVQGYREESEVTQAVYAKINGYLPHPLLPLGESE